MNKNKANPIRIRSVMCLLIYTSIISPTKLKSHLKKAFNLESDKDWKYIIKIEHYKNHPSNSIAYLKFNKHVDTYSTRTSLLVNGRIETPAIWCSSDHDLALYFAAKSCDCSFKNEFITNIDSKILNDFSLILTDKKD